MGRAGWPARCGCLAQAAQLQVAASTARLGPARPAACPRSMLCSQAPAAACHRRRRARSGGTARLQQLGAKPPPSRTVCSPAKMVWQLMPGRCCQPPSQRPEQPGGVTPGCCSLWGLPHHRWSRIWCLSSGRQARVPIGCHTRPTLRIAARAMQRHSAGKSSTVAWTCLGCQG